MGTATLTGLNQAVVLKRIQVGAEVDLVEVERLVPIEDAAHRPVFDEDGQPTFDTVTVVEEISTPVFADPGDIIDVSHWHGVESYVRQGIIQLLTPQIEVHPSEVQSIEEDPSEVVPVEEDQKPKRTNTKGA